MSTGLATMQQNNDIQTSNTNMVFDLDKFEQLYKFAEVMASAKTTIPDHLVDKPGDCMAITMQSMQWKMNPYAVAQKTHLIKGTLGYEAQLVNAVVNTIAPVKYRFKDEYFGDWSKVNGKFKIVKGQNGEYQKPAWTLEDEKGLGIKIETTLKGEDSPRVLTLFLSQATVRNSTQWASDPQQQLYYLAVKKWTRKYCPDVLMGVYTPDEVDEFAGKPPMQDVTPEDQKPGNTQSRTDDLLNKIKPDADVIPEEPPQAEPPKEKDNINRITKEQQKRLFTILVKSGKTTEFLREYLDNFHSIASTADIPKDLYDEIVYWVETAPNPTV